MIEIYWEDLTPACQQRILEEYGDNCNFDVVPIVTLCDKDELEDE